MNFDVSGSVMVGRGKEAEVRITDVGVSR